MRNGRLFGLLYLSVIFAAPVGASEDPTASASPVVRYSQVPFLNLREKPSSGARVVAKLGINQAFTVRTRIGERWCEVEADGQNLSGFVDCSFLAASPVTISQVEFDLAAEALAFNRVFNTISESGEPMHRQLWTNPQAALNILDRMFNLLERHFSLSPSLHTYADYSGLLGQVFGQVEYARQGGYDKNQQKPIEALAKLANDRLGQLRLMREAFSQDFSVRTYEPLLRPLSERLNRLLRERRFGASAETTEAPRRPRERDLPTAEQTAAPGVSFFGGPRWAVGWAGGGLARRMRGGDFQGVAYSIAFDGTGPWALADVYEMAKARRVKVGAQVRNLDMPGDSLSYAVRTAGRAIESMVLQLELPVWAVTEQGLVEGTLRKVSFGGDACMGETKIPTAAIVVFPVAVRGDIQGVFASSAPIDATRAKVTVRKRTFLDALIGGESTFTHRIDASVDLDGDGGDDLRTIVSNDLSVVRKPSDFDFLFAGRTRWRMQPVAGWYAHDVYAMQANQGGWWTTLSNYSVVTCT